MEDRRNPVRTALHDDVLHLIDEFHGFMPVCNVPDIQCGDLSHSICDECLCLCQLLLWHEHALCLR